MKVLDIGTNGKGMDSIYSLASAYGELMERIQNKMLLYVTKYATQAFRENNLQLGNCNDSSLKFRYFPDERLALVSAEDLWNECCRFLPNAVKESDGRVLEEKEYKMYYVDFYNANSKKVESVPYHLLRLASSSTGLCAGNCAAEAILQGVNEIFERYVLQQIYLKKLTPPAIPFSAFQGTEIIARLQKIQQNRKWYIEIKDCSLGKGFPVIGLLIIDRNQNRYAFRLGADISPEIALQRCFTESFQGIGELSVQALQAIYLKDDWDIKVEHNKNVVNGSGIFPKEIFSKNASWDFKGFELQSTDSYDEDLRLIHSWLVQKGYTLYIRDNSFLNFPAYHLFIPGLSEINGRLFDLIGEFEKSNHTFYDIKPEYHIATLSKEDTRNLIDKYADRTDKFIMLFPYNTSKYNRLNRLLMLALLSYKIGNDVDAYRFMHLFLKQKQQEGYQQLPYYYCVRDLFYAKSVNTRTEDIIALLESIYSKALVLEVIRDMSDREAVLSNLPLPDCFNCPKCRLRESCYYHEVLEIERRVQEAQSANRQNQSDLSVLF